MDNTNGAESGPPEPFGDQLLGYLSCDRACVVFFGRYGYGAEVSLLDPVRLFTPGMYLREANFSLRSTTTLSDLVSMQEMDDCVEYSGVAGPDYCSEIPDDSLACIFQFLSTIIFWKQWFQLCRWWLLVEGQSSYCLSLKEQSECVCLEFRNPECTSLGLVWLPVMDATTGLWLCLGLMSMGKWFDCVYPGYVLGWPWVVCILFPKVTH